MLDVACFAEAERLYMLIKDTAVHGRPLTALVLPDVLVSGRIRDTGLSNTRFTAWEESEIWGQRACTMADGRRTASCSSHPAMAAS